MSKLRQELRRAGVSNEVLAALDDMESTGLYGGGLSGVVREALQRAAREYLAVTGRGRLVK